jgi:hypothetical protein
VTINNNKINLKSLLNSVLVEGKSSPLLEEFINYCIKISLSYFRNSHFRKFIIEKTGLNEKDLAVDFIAELFKEKDGYYFQFNNFFTPFRENIENTDDDIIKSKLISLVCSSTNQRITELREDLGENYFKIKKAFDLAIKRNDSEFIKCIYRNQIFIHNSYTGEINFDESLIPKDILLFELHGSEFKSRSIPEVIRAALKITEKQNEYCKAIEFTYLMQTISEFYKNRLTDFLENK